MKIQYYNNQRRREDVCIFIIVIPSVAERVCANHYCNTQRRREDVCKFSIVIHSAGESMCVNSISQYTVQVKGCVQIQYCYTQ